MNTYQFITTGGQTYGPVEENVLRQWVKEGRINADSKIHCVETGVVTSAGKLPFLAPAFSAVPPILPSTQAEGGGRHNLSNFPVAAVVLLHFCTCGVFTLIWLNLMHSKLPRVRPDDPSAGKAIGFCFIPFFNLYWIFFTYRRLCLRVAEQRELYGLPPNNLSGMATTSCIFQVIPYINLLIGFPILSPIFLGMMQASVNELVVTSATATPQQTLPTQAAAANRTPGWAIALIIGAGFLVLVGVLSALLIPALANAGKKAQRIQCINNLKQVGLAFRIWEGDNNEQLPFNVSTNIGGTMELCARRVDGFDQNSWQHFLVMSNELWSPKILCCPSDTSKIASIDWSHFQADNTSYLVYSAANVTKDNPWAVLTICPIHHNVVFRDGSVRTMSESEFQNLLNQQKELEHRTGL